MVKDVPILSGLLALPIFAMIHANLDLRWVALWGVGVSLACYRMYAIDKRRAEAGLWRIPENTLHLVGFLGGWPGAFLAQRRLRHKTSKVSFQAVFWIVVLMYQLAAFDATQDWRIAKKIWTFYGWHRHDVLR